MYPKRIKYKQTRGEIFLKFVILDVFMKNVYLLRKSLMFAHSNLPNLQTLLSNLQSLQTQANQDQ